MALRQGFLTPPENSAELIARLLGIVTMFVIFFLVNHFVYHRTVHPGFAAATIILISLIMALDFEVILGLIVTTIITILYFVLGGHKRRR